MKTIISLILLMVSGMVFADNASAPTPPTIPTMITDTPNESAVKSDSTSNKVYLDQQGDNINANINQTGSGNQFGTGTGSGAVYLRGDNQTITSVQTGNNDTIKAKINSGTGGTTNATVTLQQIGNSNIMDIDCGTGSLTPCKRLNMNVRFTGDSNSLKYTGSGEDITTAIDTTGNGNSFNMDILSNKDSQLLLVSGDNNTFNIKQEGGLTNGQSLKVDMTGASNSFTSYQGGTVDSLINVKSVGSNGTFNINIHN